MTEHLAESLGPITPAAPPPGNISTGRKRKEKKFYTNSHLSVRGVKVCFLLHDQDSVRTPISKAPTLDQPSRINFFQTRQKL